MKILFLTETVPYPLDTGGRIKTFHTLSALSQDHEVHCHAFIREPGQRAHVTPLLQVAARVELHLVARSLVREARYLLTSVRAGLPFTVVRHFDARVFARLRAACAEHDYDAIYCDHLSMLEYGRRLSLPIWHDAHNIEYQIVKRYAHGAGWGPRRWMAEREWRAILSYERAQYPRCALIFSVSDVDAAAIRQMAPEVPITAIPIAVDAQAFTPAWPVTPAPEVLFVGGLHWPPNREGVAWLLEHIWALVLAREPNARLTIVGGGPTPQVPAAMGQRVTVAGRVDDVAPLFARSRVLAVPLRSGSGMRVKILDGFARGVPVVSTTVGAEGIEAVPGAEFLAADHPQSFADAILRVLADDDLATRLAQAGRRLVLERYDTAVVGGRIRAAVASWAARTGTSGQKLRRGQIS